MRRKQTDRPTPDQSSRRNFLKTSGLAALAAGTSGLAVRAAAAGHVTGSDLLRVGLIGCGGRGAGAALQALQADKNVKLVAMAAVYQELIASGVDVVLLATPPQFRPMHLKAAVDAGLHVFAEKPVAVDAPGIRSVLATCEEAKRKGLSVVSGLCLRNSYGFREVVKRIQSGAIGRVTMLQANDYRGSIWIRRRKPDWTDMHWQMRNWYYFTWLSGDFNVEQHVHYLDACAWAMNGRYPVRAIGMGGRQVRTGPEYGNIYDHHSVVYEYDDGAKLFSNTRQIGGCKNNMSAEIVGTKGSATLRERRGGLTVTTGGDTWVYSGEDNNIFQTEHDEMFAGIRSGKPINNGRYMSYSTLLAIMGRMATYTGQEITWEMAMNSHEDLSPENYQWGSAPKVEIALPGVTKFV
jgi:predicted dehydrogenase